MLYKITKSLAGGSKNNDVPVKVSDGNVIVITGIVEQMLLRYRLTDRKIN